MSEWAAMNWGKVLFTLVHVQLCQPARYISRLSVRDCHQEDKMIRGGLDRYQNNFRSPCCQGKWN